MCWRRCGSENCLLCSVIGLCLFLPDGSATRAEWPQWGGVHRDFKVHGERLADSWPDSGLRRLWNRPLGDGYSSIAIAHGKLYTMYRKDDHEHVVALDAATGQTLWEHGYPAPFLPNTDLTPGPGPHATPTLIDGGVCAVGVTGILHCLNAGSGQVVWQHNLFEEFDGTILYRGYSSSPIAYKESVLVTVGGTGQAVVAFHLKDGTVKWQRQDFAISHASPLLIQFQGQDQLVVFGSEIIAGLDPNNGDLLWHDRYPAAGGYVACTPVWGDDGWLFVSSAYGVGSRSIQLTREGDKTIATQIWHNNRMRVHHGNVIRVGDYVYGSSGDFGPKVFTALDLKTGQIRWRDRSLTRASCLYVDEKFIVLEEDGHLSLATMSPDGLKVHSKVELFQEQAWTVPSLTDKRLYVRNRHDIMAFALP